MCSICGGRCDREKSPNRRAKTIRVSLFEWRLLWFVLWLFVFIMAIEMVVN